MTIKRIRALVIWCTVSLAVLSVVYAPRENLEWRNDAQASPAPAALDLEPVEPQSTPSEPKTSGGADKWGRYAQAAPHLSKQPSIDFQPDEPETKPEKQAASPSHSISAAGHWQRSQLIPGERPRDFIWIIPEDYDAEAKALGFKAVPDWGRIGGELLLIVLIGGGLIFALREKV